MILNVQLCLRTDLCLAQKAHLAYSCKQACLPNRLSWLFGEGEVAVFSANANVRYLFKQLESYFLSFLLTTRWDLEHSVGLSSPSNIFYTELCLLVFQSLVLVVCLLLCCKTWFVERAERQAYSDSVSGLCLLALLLC